MYLQIDVHLVGHVIFLLVFIAGQARVQELSSLGHHKTSLFCLSQLIFIIFCDTIELSFCKGCLGDFFRSFCFGISPVYFMKNKLEYLLQVSFQYNLEMLYPSTSFN